ncbi:hypothetical protein [Ancylobacter oerskovii]|nr:hypothetical protein [Ancylobacter oerskovii]MBS7545077.1 hypothetical protein [Ancylobacter oerskovii]
MAHSPTIQAALKAADPRITQAIGALDQVLDRCRAEAAPIVEELIKLSGMVEPKDAADFRSDIPATLADLLSNAEWHVAMALIAAEEAEHDEDEGLYFVGNEPSPRLRHGLLRAAE